MLFGDTNEFDIDGRNCNGDMYGTESNAMYYDYDEPSPTVVPIKETYKYQFKTLADLLQSPEVQDLVWKTIAHKEEQIRELQNELLNLSYEMGNQNCIP